MSHLRSGTPPRGPSCCSIEDDAAVHVERLPGDVARARRGEEHGQRRNISSTVTPSEAARTRRFASDRALSVVPGQIAFTLMLCCASWSDAMRVMLMTAPLVPA